jgi:ribosomal protein S21
MYDRGRRPLREPLRRVKVEPYPGETIDSVCRRFKKTVERSLILSDYRCSRHFIPPSLRRRHKSLMARKRRDI